MKTLEERLGQRIAIQRKAVGLTQAQLAEKVDVQPETINRLEKGNRTASLALIAQLADALELELHEMFLLPEDKTPKDKASERLMWFTARLTAEEIELVLDLAAVVLGRSRQGRPR
jgi:transcriptional regulator with XRE-family HTH domain